MNEHQWATLLDQLEMMAIQQHRHSNAYPDATQTDPELQRITANRAVIRGFLLKVLRRQVVTGEESDAAREIIAKYTLGR